MDTSHVDNYIVRIYRRRPGLLVGVVETDTPENCTLFHSYAELVTILARDAGSLEPTPPDRPGRLQ
jgi:hypothetical protein